MKVEIVIRWFSFLFCVLSFAIVQPAVAQTPLIGKLRTALDTAHSPASRLRSLFALCEQRQSLPADSLLAYSLAAKNLAFTLKSWEGVAQADFYLASYFVKKGELALAKTICDTNLATLHKQKATLAKARMFDALLAQIRVKSNKYKEASDRYFHLLKSAEKAGDTAMIMVAKNGIGWVHMEMNQGREALKWFYRALSTTNNPAEHRAHANIYSNIAAVYKQFGIMDSARKYVLKSIEFSREAGNLFFVANNLNILADIYIETGETQKAAPLLDEALALRKQIGDPYFIVSDISQLAIFYANNGQPEKGIALSKDGIKIARQYSLTSKLPYLYSALADNYQANGQYKMYGETMAIVSSLKDSVFKANSAEAMVEMEAKYQAQQKENIIIRQKLDLVTKNYQLAGAIVGFWGVIIIALLVFRDYRRRQLARVQKMKFEEEQKAKEAILAAEENERKRIAADLHDNMGAYATAISANVQQLLQNQRVDEDTLKNISNNASEIMNNLRDTIWILNTQSIYLTAVSDRLKSYLKKLCRSYPGIKVDVVENVENDKALTPQVALNTLRIMQEAITNALKHSCATNICVTINSCDTISIEIVDNGRGLPGATSGDECYGIKSMHHRAKANGWNLTLQRASATGTEVILRSHT